MGLNLRVQDLRYLRQVEGPGLPFAPLPDLLLHGGDHRRVLAGDDAFDLARPCLKCAALFDVELMALINADDAGPRSADVAKNGLDHLEADSDTLQPGGGGTSEIVY